MPKEIIHWKVARRTADLVGWGIEEHPRALDLGAVFHDALFYPSGKVDHALAALPRRLHGGQGEDTFEILRLAAEKVRQEPGYPPARAFLVGLASHVFTDAAIHPFVYHHSGSYETEIQAKVRHRLLETVMDLAVLKDPAELDGYSLARILKSPDARPERLADLDGLAHMADMDPRALRSGLDRALANFARLQSLFRKRIPAALAHGLRNVLPVRARTVAALFYAPRLWRMAPLLRGPLEYLHPVTGKFERTSLQRLMEEAAQEAARFCLGLAPALDGIEPVNIPGPGPGLGSGLPGVGARQGRFFARDFLLPV